MDVILNKLGNQSDLKHVEGLFDAIQKAKNVPAQSEAFERRRKCIECFILALGAFRPKLASIAFEGIQAGFSQNFQLKSDPFFELLLRDNAAASIAEPEGESLPEQLLSLFAHVHLWRDLPSTQCQCLSLLVQLISSAEIVIKLADALSALEICTRTFESADDSTSMLNSFVHNRLALGESESAEIGAAIDVAALLGELINKMGAAVGKRAETAGDGTFPPANGRGANQPLLLPLDAIFSVLSALEAPLIERHCPLLNRLKVVDQLLRLLSPMPLSFPAHSAASSFELLPLLEELWRCALLSPIVEKRSEALRLVKRICVHGQRFAELIRLSVVSGKNAFWLVLLECVEECCLCQEQRTAADSFRTLTTMARSGGGAAEEREIAEKRTERRRQKGALSNAFQMDKAATFFADSFVGLLRELECLDNSNSLDDSVQRFVVQICPQLNAILCPREEIGGGRNEKANLSSAESTPEDSNDEDGEVQEISRGQSRGSAVTEMELFEMVVQLVVTIDRDRQQQEGWLGEDIEAITACASANSIPREVNRRAIDGVHEVVKVLLQREWGLHQQVTISGWNSLLFSIFLQIVSAESICVPETCLQVGQVILSFVDQSHEIIGSGWSPLFSTIQQLIRTAVDVRTENKESESHNAPLVALVLDIFEKFLAIPKPAVLLAAFSEFVDALSLFLSLSMDDNSSTVFDQLFSLLERSEHILIDYLFNATIALPLAFVEVIDRKWDEQWQIMVEASKSEGEVDKDDYVHLLTDLGAFLNDQGMLEECPSTAEWVEGNSSEMERRMKDQIMTVNCPLAHFSLTSPPRAVVALDSFFLLQKLLNAILDKNGSFSGGASSQAVAFPLTASGVRSLKQLIGLLLPHQSVVQLLTLPTLSEDDEQFKHWRFTLQWHLLQLAVRLFPSSAVRLFAICVLYQMAARRLAPFVPVPFGSPRAFLCLCLSQQKAIICSQYALFPVRMLISQFFIHSTDFSSDRGKMRVSYRLGLNPSEVEERVDNVHQLANQLFQLEEPRQPKHLQGAGEGRREENESGATVGGAHLPSKFAYLFIFENGANESGESGESQKLSMGVEELVDSLLCQQLLVQLVSEQLDSMDASFPSVPSVHGPLLASLSATLAICEQFELRPGLKSLIQKLTGLSRSANLWQLSLATMQTLLRWHFRQAFSKGPEGNEWEMRHRRRMEFLLKRMICGKRGKEAQGGNVCQLRCKGTPGGKGGGRGAVQERANPFISSQMSIDSNKSVQSAMASRSLSVQEFEDEERKTRDDFFPRRKCLNECLIRRINAVDKILWSLFPKILLAQEYLEKIAQRTPAQNTFDMRQMMARLPVVVEQKEAGMETMMEESWEKAQQKGLALEWSDQFLLAEKFEQRLNGGEEARGEAPRDGFVSTWAKEFLDRYDSSSSPVATSNGQMLEEGEAAAMAQFWEREFLTHGGADERQAPGRETAFFDYESAWEAIHSKEAQEQYGFNREVRFGVEILMEKSFKNPFVGEHKPLERALATFHEGRVAESILHYEAAVRKEPDNVELWYSLGIALAENEDDPRAISALRNALKLDPCHKPSLLALSVSLANESYDHLALHELHKWICVHEKKELPKDNSQNTSLYRQYAQLEGAEFTKIEQHFLASINRDHNSDQAELQNALDYDRAVGCVRAALASHPEDPVLWNRLGATLANADRSAEAINAYKRALQLFPSYVRARYNLGIACTNLNSYRDAAAHFVTAIQLQNSPENAQIWSKLRSAMIRLVGEDEPSADCFAALERRELDGIVAFLQRKTLPNN
uniref:TPR_REGION domain-containing protein n=1 Tax=Globodera pallida TaxID=36090 RepID=A0A183C6F3_GLOPA